MNAGAHSDRRRTDRRRADRRQLDTAPATRPATEESLFGALGDGHRVPRRRRGRRATRAAPAQARRSTSAHARSAPRRQFQRHRAATRVPHLCRSARRAGPAARAGALDRHAAERAQPVAADPGVPGLCGAEHHAVAAAALARRRRAAADDAPGPPAVGGDDRLRRAGVRGAALVRSRGQPELRRPAGAAGADVRRDDHPRRRDGHRSRRGAGAAERRLALGAGDWETAA